jgi:hypothetical protein
VAEDLLLLVVLGLLEAQEVADVPLLWIPVLALLVRVIMAD